MTGQSKRLRSALKTVGSSGLEHDLMNRISGFPSAHGAASRVWRMEGVPVTQLHLFSEKSDHAREASSLPLGGMTMLPPVDRGASRAATIPWMWNRTCRRYVRSFGSRAYVCATLLVPLSKLECRNGTALGFPVVPEVCKYRAIPLSWLTGGAGSRVDIAPDMLTPMIVRSFDAFLNMSLTLSSPARTNAFVTPRSAKRSYTVARSASGTSTRWVSHTLNSMAV